MSTRRHCSHTDSPQRERGVVFLLAAITSTVFSSSVFGAGPELVVRSVFIQLLNEVQVPARVAGPLSTVHVREGQSVEQEELLARVDDTQARLALDRAQLELLKVRSRAANDLKIRLADKTLQLAKIELRRSVDSYERFPKSVSKSELDSLQIAVERAELELEQARFEFDEVGLEVETRAKDVAAAEHAVNQHRVEAPFSGLIVEQFQQRGEWVKAGQAVLRLVRTDRLRAEGVVDAAQIEGDLVGRPVRITVRFGEREVHIAGQVTFVSPEVEPVSRQVHVWAEIDNPRGQLRPGMPAEMIVE